MILLTLNVFSLTGGIEKVSQIIAKVLNDHSEELHSDSTFETLSLCDQDDDVDYRYCSKQNFKGYNGNKVFFGIMATIRGLQKKTIILSHINLLVIAVLIKLLDSNKRIILMAHGIEVWRNLSPWKKSFLRKHVEIWAVSEYTASILIAKHGIAPEAIQILNNCLDPYFNIPAQFERPSYLLKRHGIKKKQPVLLSVSRLSSSELYKGYDIIINATKNLIKDFPDLKYLIAGKADPQERKRLEELIKTLGLENQVFLLDFISHNELVDYLLLADLFVMPSKKEGFGIVFIEAAACGCTVLAGNQDGSRDALLNGQLGLLVNPDDDREIETTIHDYLKKENTVDRSAKLQRKCLDYFSYNLYQNKVLNLLTTKTY
ncbi:glycosyltransferase family 4 protein [Pedobacter frigidisoli]|nr:glycosyltransferase family 4 protein [Pedobacter frigidisoli]